MPILLFIAIGAAVGLVIASQAGQIVAEEGGSADPGPTPDPGLGANPAAPESAAAPVDPHPLGFDVPNAKTYTPPKAAAPYTERIAAAEQAQGLPPGLLARLLYQESRYRDDIIIGKTTSAAGAVGIAQFMPSTARDLGIDPLDPSQAIPGAAKYLRNLFDQLGSWSSALAAYNWGIGNVKRKGLAKAPAETRAYVAQITADTGVS